MTAEAWAEFHGLLIVASNAALAADMEMLAMCRRVARGEYHADIVILESHRAIYTPTTPPV